MTIRATNPTSLNGPTGPSLLDQSKATPSDINPEIFKSRNPERQPTEGTVSSDYLKRTREEDPWPAESSCAPKSNTSAKTATVTLSDCRIDTPTEDLATDQPFQMSCQATTTDGSPLKGDIRFKLYCTLPDGTEEFTNHTVIAKRNGERYSAEGTLFSPKKPVEWGASLKYHVVAEHYGSRGQADGVRSTHTYDVQQCPLPNPVDTWCMPTHYFEPGSTSIKQQASELFEDLAEKLSTSYPSHILIMARPEMPSYPKQDENHLLLHRTVALHELLTANTATDNPPSEGLTPGAYTGHDNRETNPGGRRKRISVHPSIFIQIINDQQLHPWVICSFAESQPGKPNKQINSHSHQSIKGHADEPTNGAEPRTANDEPITSTGGIWLLFFRSKITQQLLRATCFKLCTDKVVKAQHMRENNRTTRAIAPECVLFPAPKGSTAHP